MLLHITLTKRLLNYFYNNFIIIFIVKSHILFSKIRNNNKYYHTSSYWKKSERNDKRIEKANEFYYNKNLTVREVLLIISPVSIPRNVTLISALHRGRLAQLSGLITFSRSISLSLSLLSEKRELSVLHPVCISGPPWVVSGSFVFPTPFSEAARESAVTDMQQLLLYHPEVSGGQACHDYV